MLKVLAVYPAFDPALNEMAMVWASLARSGRVHCTVACGAKDRLKGVAAGAAQGHERGLTVHHIDLQDASAVAALATAVQPDLIFCAVAANLPLAQAARAAWPAPLVLHTEYFFDDAGWVNRREYLGLSALRPWAAAAKRWRVRRQVDGVLCSNPRERLPDLGPGAAVRHLPWPHPSAAVPLLPHGSDTPLHVAYVGSLSRWKSAPALAQALVALLNADPQARVTLIGPPQDAAGQACVAALQAAGGVRFEHRASCPRPEALALLSRADAVFVPGERFSWGLIGDSWSVGTLVIAQAEHYELRHGENAWVVPQPDDLPAALRRLREEPAFFDRLRQGGRAAIAAHAVDSVAKDLIEALQTWTRPQAAASESADKVLK